MPNVHSLSGQAIITLFLILFTVLLIYPYLSMAINGRMKCFKDQCAPACIYIFIYTRILLYSWQFQLTTLRFCLINAFRLPLPLILSSCLLALVVCSANQSLWLWTTRQCKTHTSSICHNYIRLVLADTLAVATLLGGPRTLVKDLSSLHSLKKVKPGFCQKLDTEAALSIITCPVIAVLPTLDNCLQGT